MYEYKRKTIFNCLLYFYLNNKILLIIINKHCVSVCSSTYEMDYRYVGGTNDPDIKQRQQHWNNNKNKCTNTKQIFFFKKRQKKADCK